MKTLVTQEEIKKLAKLSYINLPDADIVRLTQEIEAVLSYAIILKDFATGHEDHSLPQNCNRVRADIPAPVDPEPLLALAPAREENYYVVPVIIKQ